MAHRNLPGVALARRVLRVGGVESVTATPVAAPGAAVVIDHASGMPLAASPDTRKAVSLIVQPIAVFAENSPKTSTMRVIRTARPAHG